MPVCVYDRRECEKEKELTNSCGIRKGRKRLELVKRSCDRTGGRGRKEGRISSLASRREGEEERRRRRAEHARLAQKKRENQELRARGREAEACCPGCIESIRGGRGRPGGGRARVRSGRNWWTVCSCSCRCIEPGRTGPVARRSRGVRRGRGVAWTTRSGDNGKNRFSGAGDRQFLRHIDWCLAPWTFQSPLLSTFPPPPPPPSSSSPPSHSPSHPASLIPRAAPGFRHRLSFCVSFFSLFCSFPPGLRPVGRLPLLSLSLLFAPLVSQTLAKPHIGGDGFPPPAVRSTSCLSASTSAPRWSVRAVSSLVDFIVRFGFAWNRSRSSHIRRAFSTLKFLTGEIFNSTSINLARRQIPSIKEERPVLSNLPFTRYHLSGFFHSWCVNWARWDSRGSWNKVSLN